MSNSTWPLTGRLRQGFNQGGVRGFGGPDGLGLGTVVRVVTLLPIGSMACMIRLYLIMCRARNLSSIHKEMKPR